VSINDPGPNVRRWATMLLEAGEWRRVGDDETCWEAWRWRVASSCTAQIAWNPSMQDA
jgi:hypothetical protein